MVSFTGDQLTIVALTLLVHERHGTGAAVAGLLLATALPQLMGPVAGALADRVEQRGLVVACEAARGVLVTLIALLGPPFPIMLGLVAAAATTTTLFRPAGRSAIPQMVPAKHVARANALLATGGNLALAVGPIVAGILVAALGVTATLLLDAGTSLAAAVALTRLPRLRPGPVRHEGGLMGDTVAGVAFVVRAVAPRVIALSLLFGVAFAAVTGVAGVFLVRDVLGAGPVAYGVFEAMWGIGMVGGSALLVRVGSRWDPARLIVGAWVVTGVGLIGIGSAPVVLAAIAGQALGGIGNGVDNVAGDTVLHQAVDPDWLGRAFGGTGTAAFAGEVLAYLLGGLLVDAVGPRRTLLLGGLGCLIVAAGISVLLPSAVDRRG